ncbi:MAG: hypothetical protein JNK58_10620 [Phycisphaerae bacterium]|nr:hypothetical protein [Phycisphaerae bacterium]
MGPSIEKDVAGSVGVGRMLYAGIDEAGYGPRLGPLCVGMTLFEVPGACVAEGDQPADLWRLLRGAVCRDHAGSKRGRLAVADSKALKGVGGAGVDPLFHLERGVMAFESLASEREAASNETDLLARLGTRVPASIEWYAGDAALPRGTSLDQLRILIAQLQGSTEQTGVKPRLVRCVAVDESTFNERYHHLQNKASVSFGVVGGLLRRLWETAPPGSRVHVAVDRQGGRAFYGPLLTMAIGAEVVPVEESERLSVYEVRGGRTMRIEFRVQAEETHLPVALASMTAKLVRELLMRRFNRYWTERIAGLKPTAGYGTDAGRWLRDVRGHAAAEEIEAMVRKA